MTKNCYWTWIKERQTIKDCLEILRKYLQDIDKGIGLGEERDAYNELVKAFEIHCCAENWKDLLLED